MTEEEALCFAIELMEELLNTSVEDEGEVETFLTMTECVITLEEMRTKEMVV